MGGDAVWAWAGNHAHSREIIVIDQGMLCHTQHIVLAGVIHEGEFVCIHVLF